ncbi:hypothetical protein H6F32_00355 [Anabaena sp. FACHB-1237]|uniref:hypothetical protein n=1 Tax=Anabaena sp. FACHB-1237 TaxID=2692769 RepID=UPI001680FD44|nr:hypothetical protein [Anabaena sp. FACHB-1237]MBD2136068.1 hypothetical protein [Anabaena sp. FACHB-1237]
MIVKVVVVKIEKKLQKLGLLWLVTFVNWLVSCTEQPTKNNWHYGAKKQDPGIVYAFTKEAGLQRICYIIANDSQNSY